MMLTVSYVGRDLILKMELDTTKITKEEKLTAQRLRACGETKPFVCELSTYSSALRKTRTNRKLRILRRMDSGLRVENDHQTADDLCRET